MILESSTERELWEGTAGNRTQLPGPPPRANSARNNNKKKMIQTFHHPWHSGLFLPTVGEHVQTTASTIFAQHECLTEKCSRSKDSSYLNYYIYIVEYAHRSLSRAMIMQGPPIQSQLLPMEGWKHRISFQSNSMILGQKESSPLSQSDLPSQQFLPYTWRITCSSRDY